MRMIVVVAGLATLLGLAVPNGFATTPTAPKSGHGLIVIVFKDGHRQSFNLSDIERVEFPAPPASGTEGISSSRWRRMATPRSRWAVRTARGST